MKKTSNINLNKPDYEDIADVKSFNDNMDILDNAIQRNTEEHELMSEKISDAIDYGWGAKEQIRNDIEPSISNLEEKLDNIESDYISKGVGGEIEGDLKVKKHIIAGSHIFSESKKLDIDLASDSTLELKNGNEVLQLGNGIKYNSGSDFNNAEFSVKKNMQISLPYGEEFKVCSKGNERRIFSVRNSKTTFPFSAEVELDSDVSLRLHKISGYKDINSNNISRIVNFSEIDAEKLKQGGTGISNLFADINHTHDIATNTKDGLMSLTDKAKLNGISTGATKVIVDSTLNGNSINAIQNRAVNNALNDRAKLVHTHKIKDLEGVQSKYCYVIASSTSDEKLKPSADVVCTGNNDDVLINNLISSVPDGSCIKFLSGDYALGNTVIIDKPLSIEGFSHGAKFFQRGIEEDTRVLFKIASNNVFFRNIYLSRENSTGVYNDRINELVQLDTSVNGLYFINVGFNFNVPLDDTSSQEFAIIKAGTSSNIATMRNIHIEGCVLNLNSKKTIYLLDSTNCGGRVGCSISGTTFSNKGTVAAINIKASSGTGEVIMYGHPVGYEAIYINGVKV